MLSKPSSFLKRLSKLQLSHVCSGWWFPRHLSEHFPIYWSIVSDYYTSTSFTEKQAAFPKWFKWDKLAIPKFQTIVKHIESFRTKEVKHSSGSIDETVAELSSNFLNTAKTSLTERTERESNSTQNIVWQGP